MKTALRDMPLWRRTLVEHGLTLAWLAERTGKSVHAVAAYSDGRRNAPQAWLDRTAEVLAEYEREVAA
jgi:hypothetical protein